MVFIHTETEISKSPSQVRTIFLDFFKNPQWNPGFTMERAAVSTPDIEKGKVLNVNASGYKFTPSVTENTPERFSWLGSLPYIFSGEHQFLIQPSTKTPGGTTLVQSENFTGLLSFLSGPTWSLGKGTKKQFEDFNEALKKEVEGG